MSALEQALGITQTARTAATEAMTKDPMVAEYQAQKAEADAVRQNAIAGVTKNMDAASAELSAPLPARPEVPKLLTPPAAPTKEEIATKAGIDPKEFGDPTRVFGQFMPMLVAFGALATRNGGLNALNAATAAINAAKANDREATEAAHKEWLDQSKVATDTNAVLSQQYQLALGDRTATMTERVAKVQALAAQNQDRLVLNTLVSAGPDGVMKLIEMRNAAGDKISGLVTTVESQNIQKSELAARIEHMGVEEQQGWARLELEKMQQARLAGQPPAMGDVMGGILAKIAAGGMASLTEADKAAMAQYKELSASSGLSLGAGGGGYGAPAAPGAPGAPAKPAAVPTAAKPAATVTPALLATRRTQAAAALKKAPTARAALREVWIREGLPPEEFDKLGK